MNQFRFLIVIQFPYAEKMCLTLIVPSVLL
jgi:hypothetical protein